MASDAGRPRPVVVPRGGAPWWGRGGAVHTAGMSQALLGGAAGPSRDAARAAKSRLASSLSGDRRVNGVGVVRRERAYAVRVNVVAGDDRPDLPAEVDGVPVDVAVVGRITAS